MNKADIDEAIKWFASYISSELEFGAIHKIPDTGMKVKYEIKIYNDETINKKDDKIIRDRLKSLGYLE